MAKPVVIAPTAQQFDRLDIRVVEARSLGIVGHQDNRECLLDALLADGLLVSTGDDIEERPHRAKRRYEAGIWLRTLHHATGLRDSQTGSYAPSVDTGAEEMSDEQASAQMVYIRTMRALDKDLKGMASFIEQACVWDEKPGCHMMAILRFGLDRLARMRGL